MFQRVCGPKSGALAFKLDEKTLVAEVPVKVRGKYQLERIDLKPYVQAFLQQQSQP